MKNKKIYTEGNKSRRNKKRESRKNKYTKNKNEKIKYINNIYISVNRKNQYIRKDDKENRKQSENGERQKVKGGTEREKERERERERKRERESKA